jgi:small subunit ribosomal protein S17
MTNNIKHRQLRGIVLSDKMDKTIVVSVRRVKTHPKYHKQFSVNKKYKVHDAKNEYHVGDEVVVEETRPLSRDKRWKVVSKISKASKQTENV